jgi:predicted transcriptional regulator
VGLLFLGEIMEFYGFDFDEDQNGAIVIGQDSYDHEGECYIHYTITLNPLQIKEFTDRLISYAKQTIGEK